MSDRHAGGVSGSSPVLGARQDPPIAVLREVDPRDVDRCNAEYAPYFLGMKSIRCTSRQGHDGPHMHEDIALGIGTTGVPSARCTHQRGQVQCTREIDHDGCHKFDIAAALYPSTPPGCTLEKPYLDAFKILDADFRGDWVFQAITEARNGDEEAARKVVKHLQYWAKRNRPKSSLVNDMEAVAHLQSDLCKVATRALVFLSTLNTQDHSIKEQREHLDVVRALKNALKPNAEKERK